MSQQRLTAVQIKICGLTRLEDARLALEVGADFLGFVLYPKSPRAVTPKKLAAILGKLDASVKAVGVFVNETPAVVERVARDLGLFAAQIHGDEAAEDFRACSVRLWRAVRVDGGAVRPKPAEWKAERYVMDAAVPGLYGGTGKTADWPAAKALARKWPVMLAGGLTPDNVVEAVRQVRPLGVDVAGGVESAPGRKDARKVRAFIRALRDG